MVAFSLLVLGGGWWREEEEEEERGAKRSYVSFSSLIL
jgi:hypothetical protein